MDILPPSTGSIWYDICLFGVWVLSSLLAVAIPVLLSDRESSGSGNGSWAGCNGCMLVFGYPIYILCHGIILICQGKNLNYGVIQLLGFSIGVVLVPMFIIGGIVKLCSFIWNRVRSDSRKHDCSVCKDERKS